MDLRIRKKMWGRDKNGTITDKDIVFKGEKNEYYLKKVGSMRKSPQI